LIKQLEKDSYRNNPRLFLEQAHDEELLSVLGETLVLPLA
jgi:hypothetical protein